ncbi:MAG TPA: tetratricopeptide repeat protein, partial [Clostridia bacterium]|nr:tetratricopeptide repeat protein [Clostridia bacterium]
PVKPVVTNLTRAVSSTKPESAAGVQKSSLASNVSKPTPGPATAQATNVEVVKLDDEPVLKPAQDPVSGPVSSAVPPKEPLVTAPAVQTSTTEAKVPKRNLLQRLNPANLLGSNQKIPAKPSPAQSTTPLSVRAVATAPVEANDSAGALLRGIPRYDYKSPAKPVPGNRSQGQRVFALGVQAHQARRWAEAIQYYRRATQLDPAFYEAYYNMALAGFESGNVHAALESYEGALAIRPESLDARYNFGLALKQANYLVDALNEFEKILATYPNDSRAHLALGNLYAQHLRQPGKARQHYLNVLETDPRNPQAAAIRLWLKEHSR